MKSLYKLACVWLIAVFFPADAGAQSAFQTLVWSDEFNEPGLPDSTKWSYNSGRGCPQNCGWGNNELQYYTVRRSENARVVNGSLMIEARRETFADAAYTSARLVTRNKAEWKYGRIEARAKLPAGVGTWPAIWMLGADFEKVGWPACGEIDIMEHVGRQLNKIFGTLHHPGFSGDKGVGGTVMIPNVTTEFHTYTVEWNESTITFAVDDVIFHTFRNQPSSPYHQNFYLILNIAMGGHFGGPVDPAFTSAVMEIDYIRVYQ